MSYVLIVDSSPSLRDLFATAVSQLVTCRVVTAKHGRNAYEVIESQNSIPCLILLDLEMPVMDGIEFLKLREQNQKISKTPVVVLAADPVGLPKGIEAFKKPVTMAQLGAIISKYCLRHSRY